MWNFTWLPNKLLHYTIYAADRTAKERMFMTFMILSSIAQPIIWKRYDSEMIAPLLSFFLAAFQIGFCFII
jgi:hypothetical protein